MQRALDEMSRRRELQRAHNERHGITPRSIVKSVGDIRFVTRVADARLSARPGESTSPKPADAHERESLIKLLEQQMQAAAEDLDFELAAVLRDQILELRAERDPLRRASPRGRAQPVR
jgi:excinuclease ABC subunit B